MVGGLRQGAGSHIIMCKCGTHIASARPDNYLAVNPRTQEGYFRTALTANLVVRPPLDPVTYPVTCRVCERFLGFHDLYCKYLRDLPRPAHRRPLAVMAYLINLQEVLEKFGDIVLCADTQMPPV